MLKAYAGYDVIQLVGENEPIGEPIIQYDETDWEFLKRMASHFQSVVFSDIYEAKPRMYIGVPTRNSIQLPDDLPYTASKDLLAYQEARSGSASVHHTDFFTYEIQSGTRYAIGDEVLFRDKPMVISEMKAAMDQGQLIYNYRLSRRDGIRQSRIHNQKLIGISMNGKVLDVKGQQVKLHLEIDQEQSPASAYWFPFAPPTGSAMYSMPQKGTNASLYFPDDAGSKAKVIGCVRTNGEDCSKTGDPNNRYFGTEHGSELEITPTAINVVSGSKEPLMISFDDAAGVILTSHRKLTMNAGEDISLYTPKRVVFRTPNMILAKKLSKLSGFTVESEYHLLGSQVKLDGADRTSYPKYNDEIETYTPPPPPKEEESGGWGFWDKVCAAVAVVVVVALVVTATVVTGGVAGAVLMGAAFGAVGAVGATFANDLARGEWSSGATYLRSALTGGIVGAVTGGIFGPVGGAASTTLLPATTSQVASGFTAMLASGFASGYTDYTLTELINGRRPTFTGAVTVGTQSAMFSGFLVGLRPVKNALQDLFTKGIKPKTSTNSPQPHMDELKVKQKPDVEVDLKKGPEGTGNDNREVQKPMFGEDWDAYFRSKYGDENVTWETKKSSSGNRGTNSKPPKQVRYGETDLSSMAKKYRIENQIYDLRNLVVAEIEIDGVRTLKVFESTSQPVVKPNGNVEVKKVHSEKVLVEEKNAAEKNGQKYTVHRVYTEREPCIIGGHDCKELLARELPDAEVTYSVQYGDKASRDQGNADLAKELEKLKE